MVMSMLFLVFLLCNSSCVLVGSLNDEGFVLMSFKNSIKEYPGDSLENWNYSDANPCAWHGVACREEKVFSLNIPNKNLVGILPPALGNLSALRHVNLMNNKLYGILPVELFNATGLKSLILSRNSLSGPVPSEIGKIRYLQSLDFSQNLFNGSIPSSLAQCKRLKMLVLSQNNFTGSVPDGFGTSLVALQNLNLSFNRLSGPIPGEMGNLSSLQKTLDLSHNFFTGPIPASLGTLPDKVYIDLSYNNLSGAIPQDGVLENIGPTAFIGNPLLCGPPLKILCSQGSLDQNSQSLVHYPSGKTRKASGSGTRVLVTIVAGTIVGIFLVGFVLTHRYRKVRACKKSEHVGGCTFEERLMARKESFFCFARSDLETLSENMEQYIFVPLGLQVGFDLDKLLKASAYLLGKSGMGIVYKVVLEDGITLAVRRLGSDGSSQRFKEFQTEVEAIGKIKHPNIVTLRAYCWSADEKLLIYDYIPNGDLATAIHGKAGAISFTPLSWPVRLKIMKGIAKGLSYLHEFSPKRYVHGDLKPSNVLLGQNMEPHISDFGLGRLANVAGESSTFPLEQMMAGTPEQNSPFEFLTINSPVTLGSQYQAPEAAKITKPSQKWDVYSLGLILLEMVTGKLPMIQVGSLRMDLVQWVQLCIEQSKLLCDVLDPYLAHDLDMEDEIVAVIKLSLACVHKSPERRPSIRYVSETLDKLGTSTN